MVDSVNSNPARLRPMGLETGNSKSGGPTAAHSDQPVNALDKVALSTTVSVLLAEGLAEKGPAFDVERVADIKQAVAEGRYPINPDRIVESLFQDYDAMMR